MRYWYSSGKGGGGVRYWYSSGKGGGGGEVLVQLR